MKNFKTRSLLSLLREKGYQPEYKESDFPQVEDDMIDVTDDVHIQIGSTYMIACQVTEEGDIKFQPTQTKIIDVVNDVDELIKS